MPIHFPMLILNSPQLQWMSEARHRRRFHRRHQYCRCRCCFRCHCTCRRRHWLVSATHFSVQHHCFGWRSAPANENVINTQFFFRFLSRIQWIGKSACQRWRRKKKRKDYPVKIEQTELRRKQIIEYKPRSVFVVCLSRNRIQCTIRIYACNCLCLCLRWLWNANECPFACCACVCVL